MNERLFLTFNNKYLIENENNIYNLIIKNKTKNLKRLYNNIPNIITFNIN